MAKTRLTIMLYIPRPGAKLKEYGIRKGQLFARLLIGYPGTGDIISFKLSKFKAASHINHDWIIYSSNIKNI